MGIAQKTSVSGEAVLSIRSRLFSIPGQRRTIPSAAAERAPVQLGTQQETIRAGNRTIREFADDPRVSADAPWEFFCECGCFTLVSLTLAEFDAATHICSVGHEEGLLPA